MAIPTQDVLLAPFSTNFNDRIVATPAAYALTAAQAAAYTPLNDAYQAAFQAAAVRGNRSIALTQGRSAAKSRLLAYARQLYTTVQASATVTDEDKALLGVKVRSRPTPIPPPQVAPALNVVAVSGRVVTVRVSDAAGDGRRRAKPAGTKWAAVSSLVAPTPSGEPADYRPEGNTTRGVIDLTFPESLAPGTQVWVTAAWVGTRGEFGPGCEPQGARIGFGGLLKAA